MRKRLLFLGGSFFQLAPIVYAKQEGHYIITCDYLPGNPGHRYADEYHNISTTDQDEILSLAERLSIDGIIAYASDPAASTAAYVAEKLNLPGNPYASVCILTRKDLYRQFLRDHNFNTPLFAAFSSLPEAQAYVDGLQKTVMVKPVDSSGSKGVSKVIRPELFADAYQYAVSFSRVKMVIVEEYIEREGYQIAGDGFLVNGRLAFRCFAQEHFKATGNGHVPVGESFPLQVSGDIQLQIHKEIDHLIALLNMKSGALNFDIIIDPNNDIYLMEVGPRSGGNFISEVINYSTGVNLVKYVVDNALGLDCKDLAMYNEAACYASYMLHSKEKGQFKGIYIDAYVAKNIVEKVLFIGEGAAVEIFENSSCTLGYLILKFDSGDEMLRRMESMSEHVHIAIS